jgi:hypothetical protein
MIVQSRCINSSALSRSVFVGHPSIQRSSLAHSNSSSRAVEVCLAKSTRSEDEGKAAEPSWVGQITGQATTLDQPQGVVTYQAACTHLKRLPSIGICRMDSAAVRGPPQLNSSKQ